jgi:thymidylate synthase (FAD)
MTKFTFIKAPVVHLIASTQSEYSEGLFRDMRRRGSDLPNEADGWFNDTLPDSPDGAVYRNAERLSEFAGKLCYNAFGKNGSKKSTAEYLNDNVYGAKHLSIAYHPHFTLYISGISRRIGEELKRHVIGTSVSQMSSRYVIHPARFVVPPKYLNFVAGDLPVGATEEDFARDVATQQEYTQFKKYCKRSYHAYLKACEPGLVLKGLAKKRVNEAAASYLPMATETTLLMTFNPISARKMILERLGETSDLEIQRLATKIQTVLEKKFQAFQFR